MPDSGLKRSLACGKQVAIVLAIIAATLALGLLLLFNAWPLLRGGFGWVWDYASPTAETLAKLVPALLGLLLYWAGLQVLRRSHDWVYLTWCILGAIAIPVLLLGVIGDPFFLLFSRTVSKISTGPFAYSLTMTDSAKTAAEWLALMPSLRRPYPHLAISSPTWPILYYGAQRVLARLPGLSAVLASLLIPLRCNDFNFLWLTDAQIASAWLGIASPLWAALTAIPLFLLGKQVGGRDAARTAAAWWPLIPALTMFAGTLNTGYLVLSMAATAILWGSLHSPVTGTSLRTHVGRLLAGVLAGGLLLWNFSLAPLLLLFAALILLRWLLGARAGISGFRWVLVAGIEVALGAAVSWGLYALLAGHSPLKLLEVTMQIHTGVERAYVPWLALHSWDLVLFAGLPVCVLAILGSFARDDTLSLNGSGARWTPFRELGLALGLTLLILILSGTARGETGRVWMFFMPVIVLLAAGSLRDMNRTQRNVLAAGQAFWLVVAALVLRTVITSEILLPPTIPEVAYPTMAEPVVTERADFGDQLRLLGYQARYEPGSHALKLALHWQGIQQMRKPYYFSIIPVPPGSSGGLQAQDWQPFATRFPTTCWLPNLEVVDQVEIPLGENPPPGDWWVSLSAFELRQELPPLSLPVRLPDGRMDQQVGLGPVKIGTGE